MESTKQRVYRCNECNKWFCELHRTPKFPYFVDWETVFDVQGNPEIKALFYSEHERIDGHPDFVYLTKTIEKSKLTEEQRNKLIKTAMDIMMQQPIWEFEAVSGNSVPDDYQVLMEKHKRFCADTTYNNKYHYSFRIPPVIYSIHEYYERLNNARTIEEVNKIVADYRENSDKEKPAQEEFGGNPAIDENIREELMAKTKNKMTRIKKSQITTDADYEKDTSERVRLLVEEEKELDKRPERFNSMTITVNNIHNHKFIVPDIIYDDKLYRQRLDKARTLKEVEGIIQDYKAHPKLPEQGPIKEKKKWWQ
jgi:hypothetical protein